MAYRRRFKSSRRRYGLRKRSFRRTSRISRIRRRVLSRRPLRPEIKFISASLAPIAIAASASYTSNLTPLEIPSGPNNGQRIGNQIMFRKIYCRFIARDNSGNTAVTAPVRQSYCVRHIVWSSRTDIGDAKIYMSSLNILTVPDFNVVTIYSDKIFNLSPPFMDQTIGTGPVIASAGPSKYENLYTKSMLFPRKVYFNSNSSTGPNIVDSEKYGLFSTIIGDGPIQFGYQCNTYYTDN